MKGMVVKNPVICKALFFGGEGVALGINPWIGMMVFVMICRSVEELAKKNIPSLSMKFMIVPRKRDHF